MIKRQLRAAWGGTEDQPRKVACEIKASREAMRTNSDNLSTLVCPIRPRLAPSSSCSLSPVRAALLTTFTSPKVTDTPLVRLG